MVAQALSERQQTAFRMTTATLPKLSQKTVKAFFRISSDWLPKRVAASMVIL